MNLRQLKYFIATAETGQVSRAANVLSISQSSVTGAIKDLEHELDAELFHRSSQGMELTEPGRKLLAAAQEILEKVDAAGKLTHRQAEVQGRISIAATYTVMGYFLPSHLDRIAQRFPGLDIRLHELNRESIEEGLLSDRFDMALVLTSNLANPDIETETLFRSPRRLWVPTGHALSKGGKARFGAIAQEPYIMLTVDEAAHTTMKYWSQTVYRPDVILRTTSVEAVRSMVANGQGVTILSDMVYRPWSLEGKRLETVSTDIEPPTMDVGLAWRKASVFSAPMQVIHDYFLQSFAAPQMSQAFGRG
ncbi:LysR family transcriptional regulator [Sulfitobacter sabulilitoris]|uniref:LysR family transcriptional regulator n=2 Tax=Sulfitobacter sabulilitoris TaxID=2562655 RepID=A0A5S3PDR7_9RHOB|nr:LysR family transcriptional regulator [Sulfitobacter sabulilitoris]